MNIITKIKKEKFKYFLIAVLCLVFAFSMPKKQTSKYLTKDTQAEKSVLHVFVQKGCMHCVKIEKFLAKVEDGYPNIKFEYHDLVHKESRQLFFKYVYQFNINMQMIGTPFVVLGDKYIIGFDNEQNQGAELKELLKDQNGKLTTDTEERKTKLKIPLIGEIDLFKTSLPVLSIVMGLADGFNPCAMWTLVYMISIVAGMCDRKKIALLVGSFVFSSGIMYFLFMTAWLNVFLFLGYVRILSILVGLFALYFGIMQFYEFIKNKGQVSCKLSNNKSRKKSMSRIEKLVKAELSMLTILGIIGLAFVVNSIEFACSAALPAMFTFVLTQANLSSFTYYMYILLYDIFYMLDDIIVFIFAVMALNRVVGTKYEKYSGIIGGAIMILIGIMIVFFPNLLT